MPKFEVDCSEVRVYYWTVEDVEAETVEEAEAIVEQMYQNGELHMMGGDEETDDGLSIIEVREVPTSI